MHDARTRMWRHQQPLLRIAAHSAVLYMRAACDLPNIDTTQETETQGATSNTKKTNNMNAHTEKQGNQEEERATITHVRVSGLLNGKTAGIKEKENHQPGKKENKEKRGEVRDHEPKSQKENKRKQKENA